MSTRGIERGGRGGAGGARVDRTNDRDATRDASFYSSRAARGARARAHLRGDDDHELPDARGALRVAHVDLDDARVLGVEGGRHRAARVRVCRGRRTGCPLSGAKRYLDRVLTPQGAAPTGDRANRPLNARRCAARDSFPRTKNVTNCIRLAWVFLRGCVVVVCGKAPKELQQLSKSR